MISVDVKLTGFTGRVFAPQGEASDNFLLGIVDKALASTASDLLYKIVKATNNSKDAHNKSFKPYSKGYTKKRSKKGLGTAPNLQLTSEMIKSLTIVRKSNVKYIIQVQGMGSGGITNNQKLFYIQNNRTAPRVMLESSKYYKKYCENRFNFHLKKKLKNTTEIR